MIDKALNIFLMVSYIAVVCYIAYKIMMFLMDRMILLILKSKWFRVLFALFASILCATVGVNILLDHYSEKEASSPFFIGFVFIITSFFILYYTFLAYKNPIGEIVELVEKIDQSAKKVLGQLSLIESDQNAACTKIVERITRLENEQHVVQSIIDNLEKEIPDTNGKIAEEKKQLFAWIFTIGS